MFHRLRGDRSLIFCYIVVMEVAIGIGIGVVIAALLGKKKRGKTMPFGRMDAKGRIDQWFGFFENGWCHYWRNFSIKPEFKAN